MIDGPPEPKKRRIVQQTEEEEPDGSQGAQFHGHAKSLPNKDLGGNDTNDGTNHGKRGV